MTDQEQLEHDEAELRDIKEMVETPGWVAFSRRHKTLAEDLRLKGWDNIKTIEQLHYTKGYIEALESIANYDHVVAAAEREAEYLQAPDAFQT